MGSATFNYTGAWQTLNVPTGVSEVTIYCYGAGSGSRQGGLCHGTLAVSDTWTLYIVVGQAGLGGGTGTSGTQGGGGATFGAGGTGGTGYNAHGGNSGGGYSAVRVNSTSGALKALAGGAGGDSGDGGAGGAGGASTGATGGRGTAGSGAATGGTGGTQSSGGNGGTSSSGTQFNGGSAADTQVARAGAGGSTGGLDGPGGGAGGGGFYSGGGGAAGSSGWAPGCGGGGGSNYAGGLSPVSTSQGNGGTGHGQVVISWTDPDNPPAAPTLTTPSTSGTHSLSTGSYAVSANVSAPPVGSTSTRALFRYSTSSSFSSYTDVFSGYRSTAGACGATLTGLALNTRYYLRCYAQGTSGLYSTTYDTADFYTDFAPDTPTSVVPADGASTLSMGSLNVSAVVTDFDGGNVRALFRYSTDNFATFTDVNSAYVTSGGTCAATLTGLSPNTQYSMAVYGQDVQGIYSATSVVVNFWTNRTPTAPTLVFPSSNTGLPHLDSTIAQTFDWTFNDPDSGDSQSAATLQYRQLGATPWTQVSVTTPTSYQFAANTFTPNLTYEWQVQTTDQGGLVSPWSASSNVTLSPPVVNMGATASLNVNSVDTTTSSVPIVAVAGMSIAPALTESPTVSMSASAGLSVQGTDTIVSAVAMASVAGLGINPGPIQVKGILPMGALAALSVSSTDTIPAVLAMGAIGGLQFQQASSDNRMVASAGMTINPGPVSKSAVLAFAGQSALQVGIERTIPGVLAMGAVASIAVGANVTSTHVVNMSARASVVNSAALSRTTPSVMAARGSMTVSAALSHSQVVAVHAVAAMSISGFNNVIQHGVSFRAGASMHVAGFDTIDSGGLDIEVSAGMSIAPVIAVDPDVIILVKAGMFSTQNQYVYEGPYLVATDAHGDRLSFTLNSYPIPRKVTHKVTVTDTGSIAP